MQAQWNRPIYSKMDDLLLGWEQYKCLPNEDVKPYLKLAKELFEQDPPRIMGGDTETNGLNLQTSHSFLLIFGWISKSRKVVFTLPSTKEVLEAYAELFNDSRVEYNFYWNILYDASILANDGLELLKVEGNGIDGMLIARLLTDCNYDSPVPPSLALKQVAKQCVVPDADDYQIEVKEWLRKEKVRRRNIRKANWQEYRKYSMEVDDRLKDYPFTLIDKFEDWEKNEVPDDIQEEYESVCLKDNPNPTYADVPPEIMWPYAANDVIIMLEIVFAHFGKLITPSSPYYQLPIIREEMAALPAIHEQNRNGSPIDWDYLEESRRNVHSLIVEKYQQLHQISETDYSVGQNAAWKAWFEERGLIFKKKTAGVDKDDLGGILKQFKNQYHQGYAKLDQVYESAKLILDIRALEKVYSTYIVRIWKNAQATPEGKFYASYSPYGGVSGRFTSDFQQFPREGCVVDNQMVYEPRGVLIPNKGHVRIYLDYSQIELRLMSEYTIKAGKPDVNLITAYTNWNKVENWVPTDMHRLMACNINGWSYDEYDDTNPVMHEARYRAKPVNFGEVYGITAAGLEKDQGFSKEEAIHAHNTFQKTFPGVTNYQKWIVQQVKKNHFIENALGRKYWFYGVLKGKAQNRVINTPVQGTGADILKTKMGEIKEFLFYNGYKTKFIANIHDEVQLDVPYDELYIIPQLKEIMGSGLEQFHMPIIADLEVTNTRWSEKTGEHELLKSPDPILQQIGEIMQRATK